MGDNVIQRPKSQLRCYRSLIRWTLFSGDSQLDQTYEVAQNALVAGDPYCDEPIVGGTCISCTYYA